MIVWSLFDSGNGSYAQTADKIDGLQNISIGIDIENKNEHFINLDLSDYSFLFGKDKLIHELEKLPKPDIILASPPCESWSIASAMFHGNASWKQERREMAGGQEPLSRFTVRHYKDYEKYQFKPYKSLINRINGELTVFNTIKIINHFKPKVWVIENPAYGRVWDYIEQILGFELKYKNLTYYNNYGYPTKKPTRFSSNIDLKLKKENIKGTMKLEDVVGYNERSNIPQPLVQEIFERAIEHINLEEEQAS